MTLDALELFLRNSQALRESGLVRDLKKSWDSEFFGGACPTLSAGREAVQCQLKDDPTGAIALFEQLDREITDVSGIWSSPAWNLASGRSILIQRLLDLDAGSHDILAALQAAINLHESAWRYAPSQRTAQLQVKVRDPAWLPVVSTHSPGLADCLRSLGETVGQLNPAWHFVGEMIAYLYRPAPQFDGDFNVETWVLFAEDAEELDKRRANLASGIVGRLTAERIPYGCGAVYPHPALHGGLRTDCDFSSAIQHAVRAAASENAGVWQNDYRWRLKLVENEAELGRHIHTRLSGPSGSLPFAAAILAAANKERLDLHIAGTGEFRDPDNDDFTIAPVWGVLRKTSAQMLKDASVGEICVAFGQDVETIGEIRQPIRPKAGTSDFSPWKRSGPPTSEWRCFRGSLPS